MRKFYISIIVLFILATSLKAQQYWNIKAFMGLPYNFRMPLVIHQSEYKDIEFNAYFESFRWYNMGGALAYMMVLWIIIFVISRLLVKWWSGAMQRASGEIKSDV